MKKILGDILHKLEMYIRQHFKGSRRGLVCIIGPPKLFPLRIPDSYDAKIAKF